MMRCCSCDRKSPPVSWRRLVNMICAHMLVGEIVQAVEAPARVQCRAPFSMSNTRVFKRAPCSYDRSAGRSLSCDDRGRMRTATATTRPASSVKVTWPSPIPNPSRTLAPRGRVHHFRFAPGVLYEADVADQMPCEKPVPMPFTMASLPRSAWREIARGAPFASVARAPPVINRCRTKRSPVFLVTRSTRSTLRTSMPMPKIMISRRIRGRGASTLSCRAPPDAGHA